MEYVPTDLSYLIRNNKATNKAFDFKTAITVLKQVLAGLSYLHVSYT